MPLKPKSTKSAVSVEDLIGAPKQKEGPAEEVKSPVVPKPITGSENIKPPINNFIPGIISPPVSGPVNHLNGTDRYTNTPTQKVSGFLDIMMEGHGFLRPKFLPSEKDIYISQSQIRKFQLREGDEVSGQARMPKENERFLGLLKVELVSGLDAEKSAKRPYFDNLTPIYPKKQVRLETEKTPISTRIIDLFSPIGFGQRGMIVSPPKAGKTTIIKDIAHGIAQNHPKVHLMAVLIGERPEEVTDISRSVKGEVIASNFDEAPGKHKKKGGEGFFVGGKKKGRGGGGSVLFFFFFF